MKMKTASLAVLGAAACTSAPATPTWQRDVEPVVASNCVRCHGSPALFGAPTTFRLDVPFDTDDPDHPGRRILGAAAMARFSSVRVSAGTMPPVFPLIGDAPDVLLNWSTLGSDAGGMIPPTPPPTGDPRPGNHAPTIAMTPLTAEGQFSYEIDDADFDLVYGRLIRAGATCAQSPDALALNLHAGRGTAVIDTAALAVGNYKLVACLDDGSGEVEAPTDLPFLVVAHAGGAPPTVAITAPAPWQIINAAKTPTFDVQLAVADVDSPTPTVTVTAIDLSKPATTIALPVASANMPIHWDLTNVPDGDWRLDVTATDGVNTRAVRSDIFRVSHTTTTKTYADVAGIFSDRCGGCHGADDCPTVAPESKTGTYHLWTRHSQPVAPLGACRLNNTDGVGDGNNPGLIYDRVFRRGDMPPLSEKQLTPTERMDLTEYLLAGAP